MAALPPSIGIIGGMGPWVDPLLLRKLLESQVSLGMRRDQDAIPVILAQYAVLIEDRTKYLSGCERGELIENPAVNAARVARMLAENGAVVVGIPCNTFHADPIFSRFEQEIAGLGLRVVHMVRAAIADVLGQRRGLRRLGVLSTNGAYWRRIYTGPIAAAGLEPRCRTKEKFRKTPSMRRSPAQTGGSSQAGKPPLATRRLRRSSKLRLSG